MSLSLFTSQLVLGVARGFLYFILASGLTLIFGALRVVHVAHATLYMVGAFMASTVIVTLGPALGFPVALLLVPLVLAVIGLLIERLIMRRLYGAHHLVQILATFGLVLVVGDIVRAVYGTGARLTAKPEILSGSVAILDARIPLYSLFLTATGVVLALALHVSIARSNLGRDIRAALDDPEMLEMVGVNVGRLYALVFVGGTALAGFAGVLIAPNSAVSLNMDLNIIIVAFAVILIGGIGSITGALAGSLLVGIVEAFAVVYYPRASLVMIFALMVLVLAVRPAGLLGTREV